MRPIPPSPATEPPLFLPPARLGEVRPVRVEPIADAAEGRCWNAFVERHHYLGHTPLPGAQLRYFALAADGEPLALFGFGAAAWKTAPRDRFVGWTPEARQRNLPLVVNNARFLILPWIRFPNLASHLLAQVERRLPDDWRRRYAIRPVLLEPSAKPHASTAPPTAARTGSSSAKPKAAASSTADTSSPAP